MSSSTSQGTQPNANTASIRSFFAPAAARTNNNARAPDSSNGGVKKRKADSKAAGPDAQQSPKRLRASPRKAASSSSSSASASSSSSSSSVSASSDDVAAAAALALAVAVSMDDAPGAVSTDNSEVEVDEDVVMSGDDSEATVDAEDLAAERSSPVAGSKRKSAEAHGSNSDSDAAAKKAKVSVPEHTTNDEGDEEGDGNEEEDGELRLIKLPEGMDDDDVEHIRRTLNPQPGDVEPEANDDEANLTDSDEEREQEATEVGHVEVGLVQATLPPAVREMMRKNQERMQRRVLEMKVRDERQKVRDILNACRAFPLEDCQDVTKSEAKVMLLVFKNDELDVVERITSSEGKFVKTILEVMDQYRYPPRWYTKAKAEAEAQAARLQKEEEERVARAMEERAKREAEAAALRAKAEAEGRSAGASDGDVSSSEDKDAGEEGAKTRKKGRRSVGRLLLDDALKNKVNQDGWSEARKRAFAQIDTNPNAYYYRFNAPGEKQGKGAWSKEEHELFMQRREELGGCNGKWGIFSMAIPGRVGYQCSNYYRHMIKTGAVVDDRYKMHNGKLIFKFKKKGFKDGDAVRQPAKKPRAKKPKPIKTKKVRVKAPPKPKRPRKKKLKKKKGSQQPQLDADSFKSEDWLPQQRDSNPMPDFVDPITRLPVVQPAISPYGHVAGYDTWLRMLSQEPLNTCPFTKHKITRRDLIKLTKDNFYDFKDKIVNWSE